MTHILIISRCPPYPLHLGDRLIVYHLARELSAAGVTLDLLAFAETASDWSLSQQQPYTGFFRKVQLVDAAARPVPEMARRALMPSARFPRRAQDAFSPAMWRAIEAHIAENDYDAVHLFGGVQVYEFLHALRGLPTVITPYESYSLYTRRLLARAEDWQTRLKRRILHRAAQHFERWMFAPYAAVTVVSEPDRDELHALNPDLDVRVIPNGVDLRRFTHLNHQRQPNQLMFLGNYEYAPNLDAARWLATEIFPLVQAQNPAARLWLVGNGPPDDLRALAEDNDAIEVTGRVPDVRQYYAQAAAFVCPLRFGAGIKNKVLEALAARCPLIATPLSVDGIHITDGESALLGATADALAAHAVTVLNDAGRGRKLGAAGRQVIEQRYSWERVTGQYHALYNEVAGLNGV